MIQIRRDILQIIDPESLRQRGYVGLVQSLHGTGPGVGVGAFVGFLVGAVDGVGEGVPEGGSCNQRLASWYVIKCACVDGKCEFVFVCYILVHPDPS